MYRPPETIGEMFSRAFRRQFTWRYHGEHGELRRRVWHQYRITKPDGEMRDLIIENVFRMNPLVAHLKEKRARSSR